MKTIILGAAAAAALSLTAGAAMAQPYGYYQQRSYDDGYRSYDGDRGGYGGYGGYGRGYRDSDRDGTPDRREWNRDKDCDGRPDQYDRNDDNRGRCYSGGWRGERHHHRWSDRGYYNNGGYGRW